MSCTWFYPGGGHVWIAVHSPSLSMLLWPMHRGRLTRHEGMPVVLINSVVHGGYWFSIHNVQRTQMASIHSTFTSRCKNRLFSFSTFPGGATNRGAFPVRFELHVGDVPLFCSNRVHGRRPTLSGGTMLMWRPCWRCRAVLYRCEDLVDVVGRYDIDMKTLVCFLSRFYPAYSRLLDFSLTLSNV